MSIECAFVGRLTAAPELKTSQAGKPWLRMNLMVGAGDAAQFVQAVAFGGRAERIAAECTKGDSLYVEGAISIAEWESAGEKRHALSVRVAKAETPSIGQNKKAKTETRVGDEARASSAG
jgi:single-stranded DNA-binding protein